MNVVTPPNLAAALSKTVSSKPLQSSQALAPAAFAVIADLVRARSGIVLGADKAYLVESRLEQLVRTRGLPNLAALSARLQSSPDDALVNDVVDAMTTNETLFFRDTRPFEHLRTKALPNLHATRSAEQPLRIWSAAASSGQESYSIALTVLDVIPPSRRVEILGTDISAEQIARARQGLYSDFEVSRGLAAAQIARHFTRVPGGLQISPSLRAMAEFRVWNLLNDPRPLGQFDIVFCRNVLIYFDLETKRRVLRGIAGRLRPGGLLYLGGAETVFGVSDCFAPVPGPAQVYTVVAT